MCRALGDPTRAQIFGFLLDCCCPVAVGDQGEVSRTSGPTAGEVCCHVTGLGKINSTISFHLQELRKAGLITAERQGKRMVCGVNSDALSKLAAHFERAAKRSGCCT